MSLYRTIGRLLVVASIAYLVYFIPRGWVPHDEGMIGQSAERVMNGEIPHVDYEEPYTGGLTMLYAAIFRMFGINLLYFRYALFAGAALAQVLVYVILRRFLGPVGAGLGAVLSAVWSFANYFAGLPSWWVLICALVALWGYIRYVETSNLRFLVVAGIAVGLSVLVKQTGVYLVVALALALLHDGRVSNANHGAVGAMPALRTSLAAHLPRAAAVAAVVFAFFILRSRLIPAETVYLLLPVLACSAVLLLSHESARDGAWATLRAPVIAMACALATIAVFVLPYIARHQFDQLVNGLVVLPQRRLEFASMRMPPLQTILFGVPLLAAIVPLPGRTKTSARRHAQLYMASIGAAFAVAALYNQAVYQVVWQGMRSLGALIPFAASVFLIRQVEIEPARRRMLFALTSMLAWASLVQFPFSAPIYFCYVTPLVVLTAAALASTRPGLWSRPAFAAVFSVALLFGILAMNRGYIFNLGVVHDPVAYDTDLRLDRAGLKMHSAEAQIYHRSVRQVQRHLRGGRLVAGPDSPEVYFLSGEFSPTGALFDFFSDSPSGIPAHWNDATVVVLNHRAAFSDSLAVEGLEQLRRQFPHSETNGHLEVRWR
jgi:hypothetical protein